MKKQQGFVLIFTVVLLLVAAILGLYAMRSTIMQDKMTANINNKTITTNTAEEGATQFLNWFGDRFKTGGPGWPSSEQATVWQGNIEDGLIPYDDPVDGVVNTGNIQNGRYYWIKKNTNISGCTELNTNPCWNDDNHQVTVQITGNLIKGTGKDTKILGESVYQVTISAPGALMLPALPAAITLGGSVNSFNAASSHNFQVHGGSKAAISTMEYTDPEKTKEENLAQKDKYQDVVFTAIDGKNNDKVKKSYSGSNCTKVPCVISSDLGIWGRPNDLMAYINTIKDDPSVKYYSKDAKPIVSEGDLNSKKYPITIVEGNYVQKGGGNMPEYKGVLIVLGANNSEIRGGGGSKFMGAMYVANITGTAGNYSFGNVVLNTSGAHMTISYDGTHIGNSVSIR